MGRTHVAILAVAACAFPWCVAICLVVACVRQLGYLRRRLSSPPPPRATPRIVVLIPSFNVNPDSLRLTLASCLSDPHVALVVIADGGSTDGTLQAAQKAAATNQRVTLVEAPRGLSGRANCLNLAAAVAADQRDGAALAAGGCTSQPSGEGDAVLLFLHSDTTLPEGFGMHVVDTLSDARVALGAFGIYTSGMRDGAYGLRGRLFSVLANTLNNWRSAWMETPYGDQALFCRRSTFEVRPGRHSRAPLLTPGRALRRFVRARACVAGGRRHPAARVDGGFCLRVGGSPPWRRGHRSPICAHGSGPMVGARASLCDAQLPLPVRLGARMGERGVAACALLSRAAAAVDTALQGDRRAFKAGSRRFTTQSAARPSAGPPQPQPQLRPPPAMKHA